MGIDVAVAVIQHEGPQLLTDRRAARFPGPQHGKTIRFQGFGEFSRLRGLAGAVSALEGNKQSGQQAGQLSAGRSGALGSHRSRVPTITDTLVCAKSAA